VDLLDLLLLPERPIKTACDTSGDLESLVHRSEEIPGREVGVDAGQIEELWETHLALYRTGLYPAIQTCIRHRGAVVLHRAVGHAAGNAPEDPPGTPRIPVSVETPFLLYSASKAVTAMLIHKLDELHEIHLDDRVCDYVPEFGSHGKEWITIRHVLGHRAGIPNVPEEAMDLALLSRPEEMIEILCDLKPVARAGRRLAYHAISGGFVLGEIVRRVRGQDIRAVLKKELIDPLGFRWMNYGVPPRDVRRVARDAVTGLPVVPPFSWIFKRALGVGFREVVRKANDRRFLTGIVPSASVVATAAELCAFYQCLLDGGELDGVRVFDPRTIRHATSEQTHWELDLTLGLPLRYGLGFMLGGPRVGLFGLRTPHAFGHIGFTNIIAWADPDRDLAVALLTSGKPFLSLDITRLLGVLHQIGKTFPPR
jgi:CubicO group peptidase (beta-lactamase class C family)